jgi:hypothetical protein
MSSRNLAGFVAGVLTTVALAGVASAAAPIVVNCIGEQTTTTAEGSTTAENWPPVLGGLLGTGYTVNNDGVNAGTVIAGSAESASSKMGTPGIIVIGPFAEHDYAANITQDAWTTAYKKLVDDYLALTPQPEVYVMTPPPAAFVYQSAAEQTFATGIVKTAVLSVAGGNNSGNKQLKVIDLFGDAKLVATADVAGDGHFSAAGMAEVAKLAYDCIAMNMCGSGASSTGTAGTSGGTGGAGGAGGAGGTVGTTGTAGTAGGTGTTGTAGDTGTTGTAGMAGTTTGTAGTGGTTTGTAGDTGTTGTSGTTGTTTGTAGDTGTTTGTGGTGTGTAGTGGGAAGTSGATPSRSSGGCAVAGGPATGAIASLLVALALAAPAWRRRRR